jgi:excisionase family DNA binding protein
MTMPEELLTVAEAAHLLNINAETVERWIERGLPTMAGDDDSPLIRRADLDAFLAEENQGRSRDAATEV